MNDFLKFVGALFSISVLVVSLGGLYDLRKAGKPVTWQGTLKALGIAGMFCLMILAFGAASWGIGAVYWGALHMGDRFAKFIHVNFLVVLASPLLLALLVGFTRAAIKREKTP